MLSTSSFLTANIEVTPHHNSYIIKPKNSKSSETNTLAVSHGSGGVSRAETDLADFFLKRNFTVQLFDHFSSLGITKLNWTYTESYQDQYEISLKELLDSLQYTVDEVRHHVGISLGGYLGIGNAYRFDKVFACYPGQLPLPDRLTPADINKIHLIQPEYDSWAQLTPEILEMIPQHQKYIIPNSYHSFLTADKDICCPVAKYQFEKIYYSQKELDNIFLNHRSLSRYAKWTATETHNKSNPEATEKVKNLIYDLTMESNSRTQ